MEARWMQNPSVRTMIRFALLTLAVVAVGCKKQTGATAPVPSTPTPAPEAPPAGTPQPTVTLQASPTFVQVGQSSTLQWTSTNATALTLGPGLGSVAPQGSTVVMPGSSTTYTITATGPGGMAEADVRVTVSAAAPPPGAAISESIERVFTQEVKDAYFDLDKADIRSDAQMALSQTAQFLRSNPNLKVVIEGHCDERGSTEYNLALGDRRAVAAKTFLESLGVTADRMETVSYGKEKPFCTEHDENCWQQNRRAHFVMVQ